MVNITRNFLTMLATDALKTASKWKIQKIVEATGNLIGSKIANSITKV